MLGGIYGLFRVGARAQPERGSAQRRTTPPARSLGGRTGEGLLQWRGARRRGCYRPARGSLDCALADSTRGACMSTHLPSPGTAPPVDGPAMFLPVSSDAQTPPQDHAA